MKKLNQLGIAILAIGLTCIPVVAQSAPTPSQDPNMRPSPTQLTDQASPNSDSMSQGQAFTGTIVKENGAFMLQGDTNKTSYKLDDATMAKKFNGKNVRVTGTLDSASNTIHVTNIQTASTY